MKVIEILVAPSTNSWLAERRDSFDRSVLVYALEQTSGRGQRGNTWESEPAKNLTASALVFPVGLEAARQFSISEAVALAVVDCLAYHGVTAKVKWPNDIYVEDSKICGILIENAVLGRMIGSSIAGIGININQTEFLSDAPNPVSLRQLTGRDYSIDEEAERLARALTHRLAMVWGESADPSALHEEYMKSLWRGEPDSCYPFFDKRENEMIEAGIVDVAPDGILTLGLRGGEIRRYAFKEVEFVLYNKSKHQVMR